MHHVPRALGRSSRAAALIAVAALALFVPAGLAQTPVSEADTAEEAHPAHIHTGTCDTLGDVVAPLADVVDLAASGGEVVGPASALEVKTSQITVDMPLREIIEGGHAINVHESAEAIDVYIACGDVGGVLVTDEGGREQLVIGLGELNDSGHTGTAWLGAAGDQTEVRVTLVEPDEMQ